jgi:hypothetical protein
MAAGKTAGTVSKRTLKIDTPRVAGAFSFHSHLTEIFMGQPTIELPKVPDDWLDAPATSTDAPAQGVPGDVGFDPSWSVGGSTAPSGSTDLAPSVLGGIDLNRPWTIADSTIHALLTSGLIKTIDFSGIEPGQTPSLLSNTGTASDGAQNGAPGDSGFYTGLMPFTPDPDVGRLFQSGINGHGYIPDTADDGPLARIIFAESGNTPADMSATGWAVVNRVGDPEFGRTMDAVIHKKNAFQSVQDNSGQWQKSADPQGLTGTDAAAWQKAQATAQGILSGAIPDPGNGAAYFFSSTKYDGNASTAPSDFQRMLGGGLIAPVYPPRDTGTNNYFFNRNPYTRKK